eukprot:8788785-Alexandrium_andersonii.AAC.1
MPCFPYAERFGTVTSKPCTPCSLETLPNHPRTRAHQAQAPEKHSRAGGPSGGSELGSGWGPDGIREMYKLRLG